jgi:NADH-quinone oxidoreductase subunit F
VDIHLIPGAVPTAEERAAVDAVLGPPEDGWDGGTRVVGVGGNTARGGHEARARRHLLLPALWALQQRVGWISPGGLNHLCTRLAIPLADGYGVATFYAMLSVRPQPARVVHVCEDVACRCAGSQDLIAQLEERFGPEGAVTDDATWYRAPCLGQCDRGPAALVSVSGPHHEERSLVGVAAQDLLAALGGADPSPLAPVAARVAGPLLRRVGHVDPRSLDDHIAAGGLEALRRALELGAEATVAELKASRLTGRGGAAFPTGAKWEAVAAQPEATRYVVCNADESEPGTFKDRVILEGDPFAVVEAMAVAGVTVGAEQGFVYLRGEYPEAHEALARALAASREAGILGADVLGSGRRFEIEIRRGAGAYVCGEETAIFASIEGYRGEPRNKPPFPVVAGLFGKPTVVNNVETLVNALEIMRRGGDDFAATGTEASTGTKLFCLSGCVEEPGAYEVPFGTTLRELIALAGGVAGGRPLQAVLMGGAAGGFLGPDDLDLPLTLEGARAAGTTLGSGVVVVMDDTVDLPRMLMRIAAFFRDESCGQCVPCRVGTVRQEEALARLLSGEARGGTRGELHVIREVGQCMRDASICGLGQTASAAIESAIARLGVFQEAGT